MSQQQPALTQTLSGKQVRIRQAKAEDAPACARICYEAFHHINAKHSFPPDIPNVEVAQQIITSMFSHPGFHCVVAEVGEQIAGSNCMDERSMIAGIGPITVDPKQQNTGIGRLLMEVTLSRAVELGTPGVRLVQAAFHGRSLALYTKLGFEAREPLSVMQGPAILQKIAGVTVRQAREPDLAACDRLCRRVHGHDRHGELADHVQTGTAIVAERDGTIKGYASALAFFGHAVAESNLEMQALIASAQSFGGPGILVPTRNAALLSWCLENGLEIVEPMTLMTMGLYNEPAGSYLPSISY